jgi:hypothetical protein
MASLVKNLLQQYKIELSQQDQWGATLKVKQLEKGRYAKYGQIFLFMLLELLIDEDELEKVTEAKLQKMKYKLLEQMSLKHQSSD